jgi:hypothetical protein
VLARPFGASCHHRPARGLTNTRADVAGLSYITPNDTFYRIDTAIVVPGWTERLDAHIGGRWQADALTLMSCCAGQ